MRERGRDRDPSQTEDELTHDGPLNLYSSQGDQYEPPKDAKLHRAVAGGDLSKVKSILAKSQSAVNQVDKRGRTALHYASKLGFVNVADMLLSAGATSQPDEAGNTPLMKVGSLVF